MIRSSIRRIVIAASVANFRLLVLTMVGSKTPACLLSRGFPLTKSRPILERKIIVRKRGGTGKNKVGASYLILGVNDT